MLLDDIPGAGDDPDVAMLAAEAAPLRELSLPYGVSLRARAVAAVTKRVKIVILGNPLPLAENPIRLAEEMVVGASSAPIMNQNRGQYGLP